MVASRDERRSDLATAPGFYSPWLHVGALVGTGIAIVVASALSLHALRWIDLAFGCGVLLLANAIEWHVHRDVMHRKRGPLASLYRSHVELHHQLFTRDDMTMRGVGELRAVLLKWWAIVFLGIALVPGATFFWLLGQPNFSALLMLIGVGYLLAYEVIHIACHLPGFGLLARHHASHHDPRNMQHANFNIVLPIWDVVRRTLRRGH